MNDASNTPLPPPGGGGPQYRLPIRRPVTTAMIFLSLAVFGWKSYEDLPINLMPDISYPTLTIRTEYENAAPEDVEKLLTRPLEETLSIVTGLVEISSTSSPGVSEIILEFTWDTDMTVAQQEVRDRLDLFEPPREVTELPVILRYDPTLDPIFRVAITPPGTSTTPEILSQIREAAERHIKSDLEAEEGIAQVLVKGGRDEEIQILVDSTRIKSLGLTLEDIGNSLAQQNINLSGGRLREGKTEYLVRTLNEFTDVQQIRDSIIMHPGGDRLLLSDVADVFKGLKEQETIVRVGGHEAVELEIYKDGDANTVEVARKLKDLFGFPREYGLTERLVRSLTQSGVLRQDAEEAADAEHAQALAKSLRDQLPPNATLSLISDQSRFIVQSIKEVQNTAVYGGLLALIVLFFFLRELKSTMIIGIAIPISVVSTFIPMFMGGVSLNIMSLGGLALGIGMLVDNSIVVLESIFRCKEEGDDTVDAAERGTREVSSAVTASTLTTIAVFFPIAFVEGIAGQIFRDQALTVTFSLIASLLAALYLVPMIASRRRLALLAGHDVIWPLRAYREARRGGASALGALGGMVPVAAGYARDGAVQTWVDVFYGTDTPALAAAPPFDTNPAPPASAPARRTLGWGRLILSPILLIVFLLYLGLQAALVLLVAVLFPLSLVIAATVWAVGKVLKGLLWVPLTLFDLGFKALTATYVVVLRRALHVGPVVLALCAGLAIHAASLVQELGTELIPPLKQGEFTVRMEAPPGTRLEDTELRARKIEEIIRRVPEVATVAAEIGMEETKSRGNRGENVAQFTVLLKDPERNVLIQDDIINSLRTQIQTVASEDITFSLPTLFSFKTAVEIQVRGEEIDELRQRGALVLEAISDVPGLKDVELHLKPGYPEVIINLDRDLLARRGLAPEAVAQRLRREVQGEVATRFNQAGNKIDIRVRTDQTALNSVEDLRGLAVSAGYPPVRLMDVAQIEVREGPSAIQRVSQRRVAVISGNVEGRDLGAVVRDIDARIAALPQRIEYFRGGQDRELATSYASLRFALLLAVFLVYVVMACQFESIWQPGLIMFSVPLAFVGVVYSLYWWSIDLSIIVFIGGIILAGIVVNNAIVLVDYINQLRARGIRKRDAVVEAGRVRLRPILMTTTTTVLGLLPMAMQQGEGAEIRQPMAITVMAGLLSSTVLTLVIIPLAYDFFTGREKA